MRGFRGVLFLSGTLIISRKMKRGNKRTSSAFTGVPGAALFCQGPYFNMEIERWELLHIPSIGRGSRGDAELSGLHFSMKIEMPALLIIPSMSGDFLAVYSGSISTGNGEVSTPGCLVVHRPSNLPLNGFRHSTHTQHRFARENGSQAKEGAWTGPR